MCLSSNGIAAFGKGSSRPSAIRFKGGSRPKGVVAAHYTAREVFGQHEHPQHSCRRRIHRPRQSTKGAAALVKFWYFMRPLASARTTSPHGELKDMKKAALIMGLALAGLLAGPVATAAGDPDAGRNKAETCFGCHGIPNYTNTYPTYSVPKLGGQHAERIVAALQAYQSGDRQHPTMSAQAASLSPQDIEDIAAYFATFEGGESEPARGGDASVGKEKAQTCAGCHGADGQSPNPMYPVLSSQYADYIVHALRSYKSGQRKNPIMSSLAAPLTEQDMKDLAAWFASQQDGVTVLNPDKR